MTQNTNAPSVLVVEDNQLLGVTLRDMLVEEGYHVVHVQDAGSAEDVLQNESFAIALLDLKLPDGGGPALITRWREQYPHMPILIMTAHGDIETAVDCMKRGAEDFLTKPVDKTLLKKRIKDTLEREELCRENQNYRELNKRGRHIEAHEGIVGQSAKLSSITHLIEQIAQNDFSCVLIRGESGTGKGLFAKKLHEMGQRSDKPFVELNCSALPATLAESELFGHKKGAFTDAKEEKTGLVELANGGTLFLDEIGDMDANLQTKLLKVIEDQVVRPIGGTKDVQVNVSIVAATHKDIEQMVENGTFRGDLYYRLNVIPIYIPPLRERPEDIQDLCEYFIEHFSAKFQKNIEKLSDAALQQLKNYSWPGNVREIRNVMERTCLLCNDSQITPDNLFLPTSSGHSASEQQPQQQKADSLTSVPDGDHGAGASPSSSSEDSQPAAEGDGIVTLADAEKMAVQRAMDACNGNKNKAARLLGIHRTTLYKKLTEYNFE